MTTAISTTSPRGMFTVDRRPRRPPARPCWCCGVADPGGRPDPHQSSGPLCPPCWKEHPSGYSVTTRASSVLRICLGLGRQLPAVRESQVRELAQRLGVQAWCDAGIDGPNERRFAHLDALTLLDARLELDQAGGGGRS